MGTLGAHQRLHQGTARVSWGASLHLGIRGATDVHRALLEMGTFVGRCERMTSLVDAARQRRARQNPPPPRRAGHRLHVRAGPPQAWPQQRVSPASSSCLVPGVSLSLSALAPCPAPSVTPSPPYRPRPAPPHALPLREFDGLLRLLHDCSGFLGARHRRSICMPKWLQRPNPRRVRWRSPRRAQGTGKSRYAQFANWNRLRDVRPPLAPRVDTARA